MKSSYKITADDWEADDWTELLLAVERIRERVKARAEARVNADIAAVNLASDEPVPRPGTPMYQTPEGWRAVKP